VWVGPEATSFEVPCEACMARRNEWPDLYGARDAAQIIGTIRPDADVGFTTCRRGHRIVVRRVGRALASMN
jgi:hypothetical protein